jgi:hypothetical protein
VKFPENPLRPKVPPQPEAGDVKTSPTRLPEHSGVDPWELSGGTLVGPRPELPTRPDPGVDPNRAAFDPVLLPAAPELPPGTQAIVAPMRGVLQKEHRLPRVRPLVRSLFLPIPPTVPATAFDGEVGFPVFGAQVDNLTSCWLRLGDRYVPPMTWGAQLPLPSALSRVLLVWEAPPGIPQPAPVAGQAAFVQLLEAQDVDFSPGVLLVTSSSGGGGGGGGGLVGTPVQLAFAVNQNPGLGFNGLSMPGPTTLYTVTSGKTFVGTVSVHIRAEQPTGHSGMSGIGLAVGTGTTGIAAAQVIFPDTTVSTAQGFTANDQATTSVRLAGGTPIQAQQIGVFRDSWFAEVYIFGVEE